MSLLKKSLAAHLPEHAPQRLAAARVGIAGAGGLGSNVAMLLARTGVGRLRIVDADRVEVSNLNRQFYLPEDVGRPKAVALRDRLASLDLPDEDGAGTVVEAVEAWVTPENACALFAGCAVVVEALDKASLKASVVTALLRGGFFTVGASGLGGWGLPPLTVRRMGNLVCVGDFLSEVGAGLPALAPRVMQAAALQADAVITRILGETAEAAAPPREAPPQGGVVP